MDLSLPGPLPLTSLPKPKSNPPSLPPTRTTRKLAPAAGEVHEEDPDGGLAVANAKEKTPLCLIVELAQYNKIPHTYIRTAETGPAHQKPFFVTLTLGTEQYAGSGPSVQKARHAAAQAALESTKFSFGGRGAAGGQIGMADGRARGSRGEAPKTKRTPPPPRPRPVHSSPVTPKAPKGASSHKGPSTSHKGASTSHMGASTMGASLSAEFGRLSLGGARGGQRKTQWEIEEEERKFKAGEKRRFGKYKCVKCNKEWASGNSWYMKGQQCLMCKRNVLAYEQTPLEKSDSEREVVKPHLERLCEKCKELGHSCVPPLDEELGHSCEPPLDGSRKKRGDYDYY